jgi:hypothetical protein
MLYDSTAYRNVSLNSSMNLSLKCVARFFNLFEVAKYRFEDRRYQITGNSISISIANTFVYSAYLIVLQ